MRGINKVILVGNLGANPELKPLEGGGSIAQFSLATSTVWKSKKTEKDQEQTEWHRIVMFGRLAEIAGEYLKKGSKVYIEGRLQTRKWQDQGAIDHYTTQIIAHEMQMLDSLSQETKTLPSKGYSPPVSHSPMLEVGEYEIDIPF